MTGNEAEKATILRCLVGSTIHGLNNEDGIEDRDEMAVCIEPLEEAMGIKAPFEQFIYRSAAVREGRQDAPSVAGDLDLTIYSLRKYLRLALKGNPTVLTLLFAEPLYANALGFKLRELVPYIISKDAGFAYLGYLRAQRQRLLGERGNGGHGQPRRGLIEKYGFDTKFAMHMCRLGYQGVELLRTGKLSFPMQDPERSWLLDLRNGKVSMQDALTVAGELEADIEDLLVTSPLQVHPVVEPVEEWMLRTYFYMWSANRSVNEWHETVKV